MSANELKRERPPSAPPALRRKTVHAKPVKTVTEFRLDDDNAQRANMFASLHHVHKAPTDSVSMLPSRPSSTLAESSSPIFHALESYQDAVKSGARPNAQ